MFGNRALPYAVNLETKPIYIETKRTVRRSNIEYPFLDITIWQNYGNLFVKVKCTPSGRAAGRRVLFEKVVVPIENELFGRVSRGKMLHVDGWDACL